LDVAVLLPELVIAKALNLFVPLSRVTSSLNIACPLMSRRRSDDQILNGFPFCSSRNSRISSVWKSLPSAVLAGEIWMLSHILREFTEIGLISGGKESVTSGGENIT